MEGLERTECITEESDWIRQAEVEKVEGGIVSVSLHNLKQTLDVQLLNSRRRPVHSLTHLTQS